MQQNLVNANNPIEVVQIGVNFWGYKIYATKNGLKLVDNGDGLHSLSDNNDIDSDPCAPDNWIMAVDADSYQLGLLSCCYYIQWKKCPCMKGIRLEDVTPELEELAFKQIKGEK